MMLGIMNRRTVRTRMDGAVVTTSVSTPNPFLTRLNVLRVALGLLCKHGVKKATAILGREINHMNASGHDMYSYDFNLEPIRTERASQYEPIRVWVSGENVPVNPLPGEDPLEAVRRTLEEHRKGQS